MAPTADKISNYSNVLRNVVWIAAILISLAAGFTTLSYRVDANEKDIAAVNTWVGTHEQKTENINKELGRIRTDQAIVLEKINAIQGNLQEIRQDIRDNQ